MKKSVSINYHSLADNNSLARSFPFGLARVLIFVIAVALQFDVYSIGPVSIVTLLVVLYLLFLSPLLFSNTGRLKVYRKFIAPVIIFVILLILVNLYNVNSISRDFLPVGIMLGILLFIFALAQMSCDSKSLEYMLGGIMIGGIIMSLCFLFNIGVDYEEERGRLMMFGINSNNLGCLTCLSVAIIIQKFLLNTQKCKIIIKGIFMLSIIPMTQLIFATASRTAFVSFILLFLTIIFLSVPRMKGTQKLLFFVFLTAGLYLGFQLFMHSELLFTRVALSLEQDDSGGRDAIWSRLFALAMNNPFGIGETGYTQYAFQTLHTTYIEGEASPHNVFLESYIYVGFIGFVCITLFWLRLVKISFLSYKKSKNILQILFLEIYTVQMMLGQLLNFRIAWLSFAVVVFMGLKELSNKPQLRFSNEYTK